MSRAANESATICPRVMHRCLAAVVACVVVLAGCGASTVRPARRVGVAGHTAPPTTRATRTTPTTVPLLRYTVQRGDTLAAIARRFRVTIDVIVFVNRVADPNRVTAGQVLLIPPPPPVTLVVTPSVGPPGAVFHLTLTGARPSETIRFEIDSPTGKYQGPSHIASADGAVSAIYQPGESASFSAVDPTGTYRVVATGDQGSTAQTSFRVVTPTTAHT